MLTGHYIKLAQSLGYIFLAVFAVSLIHTKIVGIETIFLAQVTFFSMISLDMYCIPLNAFSFMQNVGGYNPLFSDFSSPVTPTTYKIFGVSLNFNSNLNLMIYPLLLCPLIFLVLYIAGMRSQSYKHKPRFLKAAKSFLCEVPLTILLFNSCRAQVAFTAHLQWLGTTDFPSLLSSMGTEILYVLAFVLFPLFRTSFGEFQEEFD